MAIEDLLAQGSKFRPVTSRLQGKAIAQKQTLTQNAIDQLPQRNKLLDLEIQKAEGVLSAQEQQQLNQLDEPRKEQLAQQVDQAAFLATQAGSKDELIQSMSRIGLEPNEQLLDPNTSFEMAKNLVISKSAAVRKTIKPETFGQPVAGIGPEGKAFTRFGSAGTKRPVEGFTPRDQRPLVRIQHTQEGARSKKFGEALGAFDAETVIDFTKAARAARADNENLTRLNNLLDGVYTGAFGETTLQMKKIGKFFGIDLESIGITDDTASAEAGSALSKEMALKLRNPSDGAGMPGALSNQDRTYLARMVAGLATTKAGRKLMVETLKRINNRKIEIAKRLRQWMRDHDNSIDGFEDDLTQWSEANPIFTDLANSPVLQDAKIKKQGEELNRLVKDAEIDIRGNQLTEENPGMSEDQIVDMLIKEGFK